MKKKNSSLDGFIPRRPASQLGDLHNAEKKSIPKEFLESKPLSAIGSDKTRTLGKPQSGYGMSRFGNSEKFQPIDERSNVLETKKLSRRQRRKLEKQANKKPKSLIRRLIKWFFILLFLTGLAFGVYIAYRFVSAGQNIFQGSIIDIFTNQPLKQDTNGRSNILILGTSEDDPGHDASYLTDSIMIVSVDQTNKNAYTFSIPRDLTVDYDMACISGYSGKINEYFSCSNDGTTKEDEQDRLAQTQKFIGDILGIDIQYGVHVNYSVLKDAINAIGGEITVTIESRDPRGQMDSQLDPEMCGNTYSQRVKNCPPNGHYVDYPNGPVVLSAQAALNLSRARGDSAPTYGFELSNLDREINQQKILVAIRDKAMSTGTLTNFGSITKLMDALGDNLRSNIQINEIRTLMQVAGDIKSEDIHSLNLFEGGVIKGDGNPTAGIFEYSELQAFLAKNLTSNPILRESAPIIVLNGTDQIGLGQIEADKLTAAGFNVTLVDNAEDNTYTETEIYQIGSDNTATAAKLSNIFGVTIKKTEPPVTVNGDTRFVIIIGVPTV